jgi:hypothetical protein
MTPQEKVLYHQIHPLKLATDIAAEVVSLYFFWQHRLLLALLLHLLPPIAGSFVVLRFCNLEGQKESAFGRYVARYMTTPIVALRICGDVVTVFGAWYRSYSVTAIGLAVILLAWLNGYLFPGRTGERRA